MNVIVPVSRWPASVTSVAGWPIFSRGTSRLVDVDVRPRVIEIGDDDERRARRDHLAGVEQLRGHDAADRRLDDGVGARSSERRDLRVGGGHARARGGDLLRPGAGREPGERFGRGPRALPRAADARRRHVPPRRRVVALLARAGVGAQQRSRSAARSAAAASSSACGGLDVGLRRLRPAPPPGGCLPAARRRAAAASCASRLVALAPGAPERQLGVGRVDARDDVARRDAVAFGDLHLDTPSADLGGDAHFGRLDVAGGARLAGVVGGRGAAGRRARQDESHGRYDGRRSSHASSFELRESEALHVGDDHRRVRSEGARRRRRAQLAGAARRREKEHAAAR